MQRMIILKKDNVYQIVYSWIYEFYPDIYYHYSFYFAEKYALIDIKDYYALYEIIRR